MAKIVITVKIYLNSTLSKPYLVIKREPKVESNWGNGSTEYNCLFRFSPSHDGTLIFEKRILLFIT